MRILFDLSHPAHVHQFVPLARVLLERGHEIRLVGRDKDVTRELLAASGLPFEIPDAPTGPRGRLRDAHELIGRVRALRQIVRTWRPGVLVTRNPSGVLAAAGTATRSVFDTEDGRQVGAHYWLARPFANTVTSSVHDPESHGRNHVRYHGFKALTFLHPERFTPNSEVRASLGIPEGPLFVLRYSAHDASHDHGITGIGPQTKQRLEDLLSAHGSIVLAREGGPTVVRTSTEGTIRDRCVPPEVFLDLLGHSDLCVGDSQSVSIEAALLGIPTIRLSGFSGRHFALQLLESRYGLIRNLRPGEEDILLSEVAHALGELPARRIAAQAGRDLMLAEMEDVTDRFVRLLETGRLATATGTASLLPR